MSVKEYRLKLKRELSLRDGKGWLCCEHTDEKGERDCTCKVPLEYCHIHPKTSNT